MNEKVPMQFPYGAVYFRKSNPPRQDWERDYDTAHQDGLNIFRHWFMWGAIEVAPGVYDWSDYDRQMDLAAERGIKVIIAEFMDAIPEWLYAERKDLMFRRADGSVLENSMGVSCPAGGFNAGLCLDNPEARELGAGFLKALAAHYKGHPALLGYDVWNEGNFQPDVCYCEHTQAAFREWLKRKYGTLKAVGESWCRYSFTSWEQVAAPTTLDFYMQTIDWLLFRQENVYKQMKWRVDQIRSVDPDCLMTAHGTAASIDRQALSCYDDWAAADLVELYGLTYVPCRHTGAPWKFWGAVDLTRSAARGKTFWHAEMQGGPLWLQPQVLGRPKSDARIPTDKDVRLYNLTSMACGSRGVLYPRMRPLLNGPLFGAFGPYGMDGSRTPRSRMASRLAKWSNEPEQKPLWDAVPARGEIGVLMLPQAQICSYLMSLHGGRHASPNAVWGAYRAFFDSNIQADFVHLNDINAYDVLYLPYAPLLTSEQSAKLADWVAAGGTLIAEACTGYFNELARANVVQPGMKLAEVFGALETEVEFTPDILDDLTFECLGMPVRGGVSLQAYRATTGTPCGYFSDGRIAAVQNAFGAGRTLLIGSNPSEAYMRCQDDATRAFFASLLDFAGKKQYIVSTNSGVKARIHTDAEGRRYLWALNVTDSEQSAELYVREGGVAALQTCSWGDGKAEIRTDACIHVAIPEKDALILAL